MKRWRPMIENILVIGILLTFYAILGWFAMVSTNYN